MTPTEYAALTAAPRAVIVDLARELLAKRAKGESLDRTFGVLEVAFRELDRIHAEA